MLALAGCAGPSHAPDGVPAVQVPESIWWQVDSDIGAASLAAVEPARDYASGAAVGQWRARVAKQSEAEFIPWFTGYWTQQWLAVKLAWYKLNAREESDAAVTQLAAYLQTQYQDRVLVPVAREIDPDAIREEATRRYVGALSEQLSGIPARYGLPRDPFERRLREIPAIAMAPPPASDVSLYQLIHADPLASLPAYTALSARIRQDAGAAGSGRLSAGISPMARRTGERLADRIAASGGASAASALLRGMAGMMISIGAAGFGAMAHEQERPALETLLRENLGAALDEMSSSLMEDRATGVMAGVYSISGQIEQGIPKVVVHPVRSEADY